MLEIYLKQWIMYKYKGSVYNYLVVEAIFYINVLECLPEI